MKLLSLRLHNRSVPFNAQISCGSLFAFTPLKAEIYYMILLFNDLHIMETSSPYE